MQYNRYRSTVSYSDYFPPGVKWLLIVNSAIFVLDYTAQVMLGLDLFGLFGLRPAEILQLFMVWQLGTYMFLHGGVLHLLLNMLMLWMFGMDLERDWGTRRFLRYYFLCGVGAGICVVAVALLRSSEMYVRTIGASGAIFGLLLAFGVLYADRIILVMFLFPMKAKYAVMIFGAIEFLGSWQTGGGVSHVAHLGGMLFGFVYLKTQLKRIRWSPFSSLRRQVQDWQRQRARRRFQVYMKKQQSDRDRWVN